MSVQGEQETGGGDPAAVACQYPGCTRAVPVRAGKGRPARYCEKVVLGTVHNRANALTRRTQLARQGIDGARAVSEPVTVDALVVTSGGHALAQPPLQADVDPVSLVKM